MARPDRSFADFEPWGPECPQSYQSQIQTLVASPGAKATLVNVVTIPVIADIRTRLRHPRYEVQPPRIQSTRPHRRDFHVVGFSHVPG